MSKIKFIDAVINGDVLIDEIDDYIDVWHESDSNEEIYDFLGMSQNEYRLWVEDETILKEIIKCHMSETDIKDVITNPKNKELRMVARAKDLQEAKAAYEVIKKHGKN